MLSFISACHILPGTQQNIQGHNQTKYQNTNENLQSKQIHWFALLPSFPRGIGGWVMHNSCTLHSNYINRLSPPVWAWELVACIGIELDGPHSLLFWTVCDTERISDDLILGLAWSFALDFHRWWSWVVCNVLSLCCTLGVNIANTT